MGVAAKRGSLPSFPKEYETSCAKDTPTGLIRSNLRLVCKGVVHRTMRCFRHYKASGKYPECRLASVWWSAVRVDISPNNLVSIYVCSTAQRELDLIITGTYLTARPGFEPGISAPKADVLPLHYRASFANGIYAPL